MPYPLPAGWPLTWSRPASAGAQVAWSVVAVASTAALAMTLVAGNITLGLVIAVPLLFLTATLGVVGERTGGQSAEPDFLNAVVLSRAVAPPPDSWVHLFRDGGVGVRTAVWFSATGGIGTVAFVWMGVEAVASGAGILLLLLVPLLLGALVFVLAGGLAVVSVARHRSFARIPMGFSLGRSGVTQHFLDDTTFVPWDDIRAVRADTAAPDARTGYAAALVHVDTAAAQDVLTSDLADAKQHPFLLYTALRHYAEHPADRAELSTTFGQRRMVAWRDAIVAAAKASGTAVPRPMMLRGLRRP